MGLFISQTHCIWRRLLKNDMKILHVNTNDIAGGAMAGYHAPYYPVQFLGRVRVEQL